MPICSSDIEITCHLKELLLEYEQGGLNLPDISVGEFNTHLEEGRRKLKAESLTQKA